jgi:Rrf2 family protein
MARNCRFAVAVHVATVLAMNNEAPATSDWIAGSVNTNPVVVRRILSALSKAGLVKSQRGIAGGSSLAEAPGKISLLDLYRAVDQHETPATHHQPPNPACPVGANIVAILVDILDRGEAAKERELAKVTVADVVASVRARAAA